MEISKILRQSKIEFMKQILSPQERQLCVKIFRNQHVLQRGSTVETERLVEQRVWQILQS